MNSNPSNFLIAQDLQQNPVITARIQMNQKLTVFSGHQDDSQKYSKNNHPSQQQFTYDLKGLQPFSHIRYPSYRHNCNYYQEFWRIYLQNEILIPHLKELTQESKVIKNQISVLELKVQESELNLLNNRKKRGSQKNRFVANEIAKTFACSYQNCAKLYGSNVSLNLHIKFKHGGDNKEREKPAATNNKAGDYYSDEKLAALKDNGSIRERENGKGKIEGPHSDEILAELQSAKENLT